MSRWLAVLSWLTVIPYAYAAFFVGDWVGGNAKTPQTAAILFWSYLAVYPTAVLAGNLAAWRMRVTGRRRRALAFSLFPYGVLAAAWFAFPAFVRMLCRVFV